MQILAKTCGLVLALSLLGGVSFAAVDPQDETVTVTGQSGLDGLTADLDPLKDHYFGRTGEEISRDIDPIDRYSAFREFAVGLSGPLREFYDWRGLRDDGVFFPTRQFYQAGLLCRDFTEETDHHDAEDREQRTSIDIRPPIVFGTACHEPDGWHFR